MTQFINTEKLKKNIDFALNAFTASLFLCTIKIYATSVIAKLILGGFAC